MTDAVAIIVIPSAITTIGLVLVALINTRQNKKITTKVDGYHTEVNGKMTKLLETTEALGKAKGKAEQKEKPG